MRDWVQPGLLDLAASKIAKATIEIPGEEPLVIARDEKDAGKHTLVGIPDGKKLKEGAGIDGIVRAAGSIELEDVRKPPAAPGGEAGVAKIEADGGLAVALRLRKEGEAGRKKLNEITRWLTVPICMVQALVLVQQVMRPESGGGMGLRKGTPGGSSGRAPCSTTLTTRSTSLRSPARRRCCTRCRPIWSRRSRCPRNVQPHNGAFQLRPWRRFLQMEP